jgi:hypothetical protein
LVVYLNQRYVFDLLAMAEGGLTQLETIKTSSAVQSDHASKISGDVGFSNVFAFIGLKGGGERFKSSLTSDQAESSIERVHTPNSLFGRLRAYLWDHQLIAAENLNDVRSGDFVEVKASLSHSPVIRTFERLKDVASMASAFGVDLDSNQVGSGSRQQPKQNQGGGRPKQSQRDLGPVAMISGLLEQLRSNETTDLIGQSLADEATTLVVSVENTFLSNSVGAGITDGEYRVLGKVARVLPDSTSEPIKLLRNTRLGIMPASSIEDLLTGLYASMKGQMDIPEPQISVTGPALLIIPIAIFS